MNTLIRNVRDLEAANRRSLESLLGQPLSEDEQVIIRVVAVSKPTDAARKQAAFLRLREISEEAARSRESQGVSSEEVDRIIDEAIEEIRRTPS